MANVLAVFNKTEDAQEIYKLMTHANPNIYQPLVNQAHLSIGQRNFELSINLYQKVIEKFMPNDLRMQMYLAKAFYYKGDFQASKNLTMKLITRHPNSMPLKFNLALCLYSLADKIFNMENRRVYHTKEAILYLKQALKLFHTVQRNFEPQYSFIRSADLTKEAQTVSVEAYNDMLKASENKIYLIEDMLQVSQQQLEEDMQEEQQRKF